MGLDNGCYIKSDKRKLTREDLPQGLMYPFEKDYGENVEIAYWRKCWGLRNSIMNHFGWRETPEEQYKFEIETPEQVLQMIEVIAAWLDEEIWLEDGNSIWTYQEIRPILIHNICNFAIVYGWMLSNPDVYIEFYDSY